MNDVVLQGSITKYVKRLLLDKIIDDTPLQAPKGSVIFKENEHIKGVFYLIEGVCKTSKLSPTGKNHIIRLTKKGELLGLRSVMSQNTTNLMATALTDVQYYIIPKEYILSAFSENPSFVMELAKIVSDELRKSDNQIVDMVHKRVKQRLAETLCLLENTFGTDAQGYIASPLVREEIANLVGTATESLIRTLSDFAKDGIVELKGKLIRIANRNLLKKIHG